MSGSSLRHGAALLAAFWLAGVLAGCAPDDSADPAPASDARAAAQRWFPPCPRPATGTASPSSTGAVTARAPAPARSAMPSVSLECLGESGGRVDLAAALGSPVVVNIWASWCKPCREELPHFQRYAEAADDVLVLGVVSNDTYPASLSLAKELHLRFPTLYDSEGALIKTLGRTALPVTLFIDASGRLAHVYNGQPLTEAALAALAEKHLGVRR
ncbi:MAG: redoxin domain-containing protein [Micromonosporaceae bacterium]|nr:redoxin domain-containing protein [Micromonosporaceae bacterium]